MSRLRYIAVFSQDGKRLKQHAPHFSPRVEFCHPDGILFAFPARYEQDTLTRINSFLQEGDQIGGGPSRTVAILAAQLKPGSIISPGKEKAFLGSLPTTALNYLLPDIDTAFFSSLESWGIRTLGELSELPSKALAARLGKRSIALQKLARGEDLLYSAATPGPVFEAEQDLDWELDSLEPLSFLLDRVLEDFCREFKSRGLAVAQLHLLLRLSGGQNCRHTLIPAVPMQDHHVLLSLLRMKLQQSRLEDRICGFKLKVDPAPQYTLQYSLLQFNTASPEDLSRTLARLEKLIGPDNIGCPVLLDTHRPDAFQLQAFQAAAATKAASAQLSEETDSSTRSPTLILRRLRPSRPIDICSRDILHCAGPWRRSGDWWDAPGNKDAWARDEWDVELTSGEVCRVYWDHYQQKWFLEGTYD